MMVRWGASPAQLVENWRDFGRLVDDTFGMAPASQRWEPAVDVTEDAKSFQLAMDLPGVRSDEVKIEVDGRRLTVSGTKKPATSEDTPRPFRSERRFGTFRRVFTLPESVATDSIEARARDGVLFLTLPKVEKAQPRQVPVVTG